MHPTDVELERHLRGDLPARDRAIVSAHLSSCAECERRARSSARDAVTIDQALRALDHAPPLVHAETIMRRVRSTRVRRLAAPRLAPRLAAAAALALLLAGAAVAMPGSPVAAWIRHALRATPSSAPPVRHSTVHTPAVPPAPVSGSPHAASGVIVVPDAEFEIAFESRQESGVIRLALVDADELSVRGASGVEYRVLPAGVEVRNQGATATYDVRAPSSLQRLRVVVAGRLVFVKSRHSIRTRAVREPDGTYIIRLSPP